MFSSFIITLGKFKLIFDFSNVSSAICADFKDASSPLHIFVTSFARNIFALLIFEP